MAKVLPIITTDTERRQEVRRVRALLRKVSVIRRNGSIAQKAERTTHNGEVGRSIRPRAT